MSYESLYKAIDRLPLRKAERETWHRQLKLLFVRSRIDDQSQSILEQVQNVLGQAKVGIKKQISETRKALECISRLPKAPITESLLQLPYSHQVEICDSAADYRKLFSLHEVPHEDWRSSSWLREHHLDSLCGAIRKKFDSWERFKDFMGPEQIIIDHHLLSKAFTEQVSACQTSEDLRALFKLHEITEDQWRSSGWLDAHEFAGLYQALYRRFGSWGDFLLFMGAPPKPDVCQDLISRSFPQQVAACEAPDDFRQLFELHSLSESQWQSSNYVSTHLQGLYVAIRSKFGGWKAFREFMGIAVTIPTVVGRALLQFPYTTQVSVCKTPQEFLSLLGYHDLLDKNWRSPVWLTHNGWSGLYAAIIKDERFGAWNNFLIFLGEEDAEEQSEFDALSEMNLEDAIALLREDPLKLKLYLKFAHPELGEEEVDLLVIRTFKGLSSRRSETREAEYLSYPEKLPSLSFTQRPTPETSEHTVIVAGVARGSDSLYVSGTWNRRLRVESDGTFTATIPLKIGETNEICIMGINRKTQTRTHQEQLIVEQMGKPDDIESLIKLLSDLGTKERECIKRDPGRKEFLVRSAEQMLIKKFTHSFEEGRNYIENLIETSKSPVVRTVLKKVLSNFRVIDRTKYPNIRPDEPLYFFQKYCVARIRQKMEADEPGVVLANDPGLGKTRTAWVAINHDRALIVAPNSVVSTWGEEAAKCLKHSDFLILQHIPHKQRKVLLAADPSLHRVTNIEFLREHEDQERLRLLSDDETIIVHDEAHSLSNLESDQTIGAKKLARKFLLCLTATPAKNPVMLRRLLHNLYPDDTRYSSDRAFQRAFPAEDPEALRTLSLIKQKSFIRFRKQDVMEEVDPALPLDHQRDRLPKKEYVSPGKFGQFTMSDAQSWALYEMFLDWDRWSRKYNRYIPRGHVAQKDNLRRGDFLTKRHALRQTVNNPEYINATGVENAKATEMRRIVEKCLHEKRKIVIFCAYNAQALKYAELFRDLHPAVYTGLTSDEGMKRDVRRRPIRYRKNPEGGWALEGGYPIEDPKGQPMLALDYERLTFQNAEDRKLMIATYSAGAVGVTFTAGKAVIDDDLPSDCIVDIQHEDRTHRIDHEHQTHYEVKHYRMMSKYSEKFLSAMKKRWVVRQEDGSYREYLDPEAARSAAEKRKVETTTAYEAFFAQGTFDQVQLRNLATQRTMFHLINDGIADKSLLDEDQQPFLGI